MNIIYASCLLSTKKANELFSLYGYHGFQVQKFHKLLTNGLVNNNCTVQAVTALPLTRKNCKRIHISKSHEIENHVNYIYLNIINIPILKNICTVISSFFEILRISKRYKNSILIADCLNQSVSLGTVLACRLSAIRTVGIITDIPDFLSSKKRNKINNNIIRLYDSYIYLTEQMNDYVTSTINHFQKPYIVIEGMADSTISKNTGNTSNPNSIICIYAGTIHKKYGIDRLVEAFINANINGAELHIYGDGDFKEELEKITEKNNNVKYYGVKPNNFIIDEIKNATLLINPRPSHPDYTKYSFPSKNMEYLASGTPFLTTKLPGIPKEYFKYMYVFDDESIDSMSKKIIEITSKSKEELKQFGKNAQDFVLNTKNETVQAKKIIEWIKNSDDTSR